MTAAELAKEGADYAESGGDALAWTVAMRKWWFYSHFDLEGSVKPPESFEVSPEFHAVLAAAAREKAYAVYPDVADIDGAIKFRNRPVVARA